MRVLFFALGGSRRLAVVEESAQIVASGGTAVVLIDRGKPWSRAGFAPGVTVVEVSQLERTHAPQAIERRLVYDLPRSAFRLIGRRKLRRFSRRAARAVERQLADRIHRRLFLPVYNRFRQDVRARLIRNHVLRRASFDLWVVSDPKSVVEVARLMRRLASGSDVPHVSFSIDCAPGHAG